MPLWKTLKLFPTALNLWLSWFVFYKLIKNTYISKGTHKNHHWSNDYFYYKMCSIMYVLNWNPSIIRKHMQYVVELYMSYILNQLTELRSTLVFVTHESMYCKIIWYCCFHFAWKMKIMTSDAIFFPISSKFRRITQCGLHTSKCISDILQIVEKLPEKSWNVSLNMCTISHIFLHSKYLTWMKSLCNLFFYPITYSCLDYEKFIYLAYLMINVNDYK